MLKQLISSGLVFSAILGSSILMTPVVEANPRSCDWFTGTYKDLGIGRIIHIGDNKLIVYNGNPTPLNGRCISADEIEVDFPRGRISGRKTRNGDDIAWSNRTVWRRISRNVEFK